jgi:SAM-dependent methyltransferase
MSTATIFKLICDVATLRVPSRVLVYGAFNFLNRRLQTGNRRYEFERLYAEHGDVWSFSTSEYEKEKYRNTLVCALGLCCDTTSALEVGCGTGVFSGLLAKHFSSVLAIDLSDEALKIAKQQNVDADNIRFIRGDVRALTSKSKFDLIICAEVLYYLRQHDSDSVCCALDRLLGERGVVLTVSGIPKASSGTSEAGCFNGWNDIFSRRYSCVLSTDFTSANRPYRVAGFLRRYD